MAIWQKLNQNETEVESEISNHQFSAQRRTKNMTNRKEKSIPYDYKYISLPFYTVEWGNSIEDIFYTYTLAFMSSFRLFFICLISIMRILHLSNHLYPQHLTICSRFNLQCSHSPFQMAFQTEIGILTLAFHSVPREAESKRARASHSFFLFTRIYLCFREAFNEFEEITTISRHPT